MQVKLSGLKRLEWVAVASLVVAFTAAAVTSAATWTQTVDEAVHLSAGYAYWRDRGFHLNPEHPPFVKLVAAAPLLALPLDFPDDHPSYRESQWEFGRQFLYHNRLPAETILLVGRLPVVAIGITLLLVVWRVVRCRWGPFPALVALAVVSLDPTIVAHSSLVTTDIGLALGFLLAILSFHGYLQRPTRRRLLIATAAFAAALLAKFSAIILLPIYLLLFLLYRFHTGDDRSGRTVTVRRVFGFFGVLAAVSALSIFVAYGFEFKRPFDDPSTRGLFTKGQEILASGQAADEPPLVRSLLPFTDPDTERGERTIRLFETVPIPAYSFLRGAFELAQHNYWGHRSYLLGMYADSGWWYYFPIAYLVKTPLAIVVLLLLTVTALTTQLVWRFQTIRAAGESTRRRFGYCTDWIRAKRSLPFTASLFIVPPVAYFAWSMTSHLNLGVRHVLPVYPFVAIGVGWLASHIVSPYTRAFRAALVGILTVLAASFIIAWPNFLAYFSESVGGSANGHRYLVDSNLDWGQDLGKLKQYLALRQIEDVALVYFGSVDIDYFGFERVYLPTTDEVETGATFNGVAAVSVTALLSKEREYGWLLDYEPSATIGWSMWVYDMRK